MSWLRGLVVLSILVATAVGTWYYLRTDSGAKKPQGSPAVPVKLAKATVRDMPIRLDLTGRTEAFETVSLKPRVEGQVLSVNFNEGQHVAQGDVLLKLDPADFQARLNQAEANLARSQAQLAKAKADVERYIALRGKGFVSEEKVGEMRTAALSTESTVKADSAAAELARLQLSYTTIRAPFAGIVGAKLVFPGAAVKVNETVLAVINKVQPLNVSFAVPEKYLAKLHAGMRAQKNTLTAAVSLPGSAEAIEVPVRFLDNGVDTATGTIQLKASLPNKDEKLSPGQFVNVSLVLDTLHNAVVIPTEAVQQGANGSFVFVAKDDSSVEVRNIRLASTEKQQAIVAEGLKEGEAVVTEGQLRLTAGAKIRLAEPPKGKAPGDKPAPGAEKPSPK